MGTGLLDRSLRLTKTRTDLDQALCKRIEQLRRSRMRMRMRHKDSAVQFLLAAMARYGPIGADSAERTAWLPVFLSYDHVRRQHSALICKPPQTLALACTDRMRDSQQ